MATTTLQLDLIEDAAPSKVYLYTAESGLVSPASGGYTLTLDSTQEWRYTATVTEACVGVYRAAVHDGDGLTVAQGYIWIQADDTGTYIAVPDFATAKSHQLAVSIESDTNELQGDWTNNGRLDVILDAILLDTGTTIPATLTTIEADTNELQTDWTNDGRLDLILDSIKTDSTAILVDTGTTLPNLLYSTNTIATGTRSDSIYARVDETKSITVNCSKDVEGLTLAAVFETADKTDVGTIADGDITKSTTTAAFALTAALTASERTLRYTIKDTATDETLASGKLFVTYDAQAD
jgi:hypothetical protein